MSRKKKLTYEEVKKIVNDLGYELVSKEYMGVHEKLILKDNDGYFYMINLSNVKLGKNPNKFDYFNLYTIQNIKLWLKLNIPYLELISNEYISMKQKIKLRDKEGYFYSSVLNDVLQNRNPARFHKSNIYTIQNIKLWCKLNNKLFELISEVYEGNNKKLQWKCLKEECSEIFKTTWADISQGVNCGYCDGKQVGLSNCLATKNPELAKEWHPTKNGDLTPYDITIGYDKKVWWQCSKNHTHEWNIETYARNGIRKNGCPYCAGRLPSEEYNLLFNNPLLCEEWNYEKNDKRPDEYCPNSGDKVWWKCKIGHEWETIINLRNDNGEIKVGCPYCVGMLPSKDYNLLKINPKLCEEWNYDKNEKLPEEYTPVSGQYAWWQCKECNCEWETKISNRVNGRNCPECNESKGELKIREWLRYKNYNYIPQKQFNGLVGIGNGLLSYDFYLPDHKLLIEFQGEQHERFCKGVHKTVEDFIKQQEHDKRKKEHSLRNEYDFLEIWYYDFDNIEEILEEYFINIG